MKMNLSLILDDILPVYTTDKGTKVVNARTVHASLGISKDYSSWIKQQIRIHQLSEGAHYVKLKSVDINTSEVSTLQGENSKGGRIRIEYILRLEVAKKIAMGTNNAQGDVIKNYFLKCEEIALSAQTPATSIPMESLALHTNREVQVCNVKAVNAYIWQNHNQQDIIRHHQEVSKMLTGKLPNQIMKEMKDAGIPSKYRSSGRECMRYRYPGAACAASVCDELVKKGKSLREIQPFANKLADVFGHLLQIGVRPAELSM